MQAVPDKITPRLLTKTHSLPLASFALLRLCERNSRRIDAATPMMPYFASTLGP